MAKDLSTLVNEWSGCASALETALKERNFEKFQSCIKDGKELSSCIKGIINSRPADGNPLKQKIKSVSDKWTDLSDEIRLWMLETKAAIKVAHDNQIKDRKLNNVYNHLKTTGVSLKIKAK